MKKIAFHCMISLKKPQAPSSDYFCFLHKFPIYLCGLAPGTYPAASVLFNLL